MSMQITQRLQRASVVVISAIALGFGGCASTSTSTVEPEVSETAVSTTGEELQVITTFLPITQFTRAVAGNRAEVTQLLPTNVGPHDYQAKPEDAQAIANADVLVKNGLEMEAFLDDLIDNAGNSDLVVIDSSEGIATLSNEEIEGHDHSYDHDHAHEEDHTNAEAGHHHHGEFNPHIWLDPKRAIQQVENIRDGLIAADPEGEADYTANAAAYIEDLQALDAEITERLAPYQGQTFVAFHDFAPYFADSYNLNAQFLVDVPDENPSPDDVQRVIETVEDTNLKTLLTEPQVSKDAFAALANDLNVKVSTFDPLETGDPTASEPEYYLTIMRQNVESLEAAFEGPIQSWLFQSSAQPIATLPQPVGLRF